MQAEVESVRFKRTEVSKRYRMGYNWLNQMNLRGIFSPSVEGGLLFTPNDCVALGLAVSLRAKSVSWDVIRLVTDHIQSSTLEELEATPILILFGDESGTAIHALKSIRDFRAPADGVAVTCDLRPSIASLRAWIAERQKAEKAGRRARA